MTHPNHESESNPMTDTENNYVEITDLLLMVPFSFYRSYKGVSINLRPFFLYLFHDKSVGKMCFVANVKHPDVFLMHGLLYGYV